MLGLGMAATARIRQGAGIGMRTAKAVFLT
jgi:hypothetical protein